MTREGSGEPAHPCSLTRAFAVRTHDVWKQTKSPTKNQTSSPTGLLCMRFWWMSLRRTESPIISWDGYDIFRSFLSVHMASNIAFTVMFNWKWAASWQNQQNDCMPSKDSDQPGHPPSLIRVFAVLMKKAWVLSYPLSAQRRLWSDWVDAQADPSLRWDWADAQADQSLCWAHSHFVGFDMRRLK